MDEEEIKQSSLEYQKTYGKGQDQEMEVGLEEGDISDYIMPLKGLGKKGLKSAINMMNKLVGQAGTKQATKKAAGATAEKVLDYSRMKSNKSLKELAQESEKKAPTLRYRIKKGRQDTSKKPEYIPGSE